MEQNLESPRIVYREITLNEAFSTATEGISSQSHPIISQDFGQLGGDFDEESKRILETKVKEAHEKGFLVKIEGVPKSVLPSSFSFSSIPRFVLIRSSSFSTL